MADRPILFSAPMIRALLDGRKTQTRRVLKLPTKAYSGGPIYEHPKMGGWEPTTIGGGGCFTFGKGGEKIPAPERVGIWHRTCGVCMAAPYQSGDRLWVRETWKPHSLYAGMKPREMPQANVFYPADDTYAPSNTRWVPSIHMPRWASRLTLLVTEVRVQRLHDISEADALAEGVVHLTEPFARFLVPGVEHPNKDFPELSRATAREMYAALWDAINGSGAWLANPWVAAVTFDVRRCNIDSMEG